MWPPLPFPTLVSRLLDRDPLQTAGLVDGRPWPPPGKSCGGPFPSFPTTRSCPRPPPPRRTLRFSTLLNPLTPPPRSFYILRVRRACARASVHLCLAMATNREKKKKKGQSSPYLSSLCLTVGARRWGLRGPHFPRPPPPPPPSLLLGWSQNLDVPFFPRPFFLLLFFHSLHDHISFSFHVEFLPPLAKRSAQPGASD